MNHKLDGGLNQWRNHAIEHESTFRKKRKVAINHLYESNIKGSFSEALTAHIDVVLSDDGGGVGCDGKDVTTRKIREGPPHNHRQSTQRITSFKESLTAHSAAASTLGAKHLLRVRIQQSLSSHFIM